MTKKKRFTEEEAPEGRVGNRAPRRGGLEETPEEPDEPEPDYGDEEED